MVQNWKKKLLSTAHKKKVFNLKTFICFNYILQICTIQSLKGVGNVDMPFSNLFIMLDCTKTSKGLFFGLVVFVGTILSIVLFMVYNGKEDSARLATLISEIAEIVLLLIALVITILAFIKVRAHYQIAKPQINMFDILVILDFFILT